MRTKICTSLLEIRAHYLIEVAGLLGANLLGKITKRNLRKSTKAVFLFISKRAFFQLFSGEFEELGRA